MPASPDIENIISQFNIQGSIAQIKVVDTGHINDTYHLQNADAMQPDYLLQRINHAIFKNVPGLMDNIRQVTEHLKAKLAPEQADTHTMTIVKLHDGSLFLKDHLGNYWRIFHFIKGTRSYDLVTTTQQAFEGGKAFGRFQSMLTDLNPDLLQDTIPDFHNMEHRLDQLEEALNNNLAGRAKGISAELEFINEHADEMCGILYLGNAGRLPWRITHNDTKFNNVLLDASDRAQCVIDLDTVMPGYVAYDFGDAIRTIINTAAEDEVDLSKIDLNILFFEDYTKGYFEKARSFLTDMEVQSLLLGVFMLPFIQAVRFITDYLNGDIYFKINHTEHNLQRARAQIQLIRKLEENKEDLRGIINSYR
ncbi:phosphotransferase enzyme family protein [Mucilaginibacter glaciei]|uniref:Aminoglycoside phosphotransferase family protein n=1 Tax=Mucilaginibacter glaciei TaxID=2772109 RepID=A0A926NRP7_9SPHI|nr:aminoglycoside phosphotransferase family protein [Mucilaginibacter glaciei]MBD1394801.1 aminoglycoside phosphotransferase family protein [Mucilaginibacter glaciei]